MAKIDPDIAEGIGCAFLMIGFGIMFCLIQLGFSLSR